jgi:hypothetical protein
MFLKWIFPVCFRNTGRPENDANFSTFLLEQNVALYVYRIKILVEDIQVSFCISYYILYIKN